MRPRGTAKNITVKPGTSKTLEVVEHTDWYVITHKGRIATVRTTDAYEDAPRYSRNGWFNESQARTQARKYNQMFNTTEFDIRKI